MASAVNRGEPGLPLTERVHARLREDILTARLLPGSTILEPELAARFGVSKTPVREALRLLVQDGWVIVLPRRGYLVRPLGLEDLRDVFQLREMIEPGFAAEAAARVGAADRALTKAVTTQQAAHTELRRGVLAVSVLHDVDVEPAELGVRPGLDPDRGAYRLGRGRGLGAAADFHVRVAELSGNARATRIVSQLVDEVTRLHFLMPTLEHHISSADEIRSANCGSLAHQRRCSAASAKWPTAS